MIRVKRVYEPVSPRDGKRFLVDRVWPRGLKKEQLVLELWARDAAPSTRLRKWFGHREERWTEFLDRYAAELATRHESWQPILNAARRGTVTLLFAAKDEERNNAVALQRFLRRRVGRRRD